MNFKIPSEAEYILNKLEGNGYEAYVVGGCVRDIALGKEPDDWDICTPAQPGAVVKCFPGKRIIETGIRHGTVTLWVNGKPFEITTYRVDGAYSDNRHPDSVKFVNLLEQDLSRRDFTVNAMAYNPRTGLADFFGGTEDLKRGVIRCVGRADTRFNEDALRIMRAMRFSSVLGFDIDAQTSDAVFANKSLLKNIAPERISAELNKLITGKDACGVLLRYAEVVTEIIPETEKMIGFKQNTPYHYLDVFEHTLESIKHSPTDAVLRLAALFHDIAKPLCYCETEGVGHFYGHPKISSDMAASILKRLKYDSATVKNVAELILHHDSDITPQRKCVKRWLNKIGETALRNLIELKRADTLAKSERFRRARLDVLDKLPPLIDEIIKGGQCFLLKDLAVSGHDLIALGVPEGADVGRILNMLMDMVIDESAPNDKQALLDIILRHTPFQFFGFLSERH